MKKVLYTLLLVMVIGCAQETPIVPDDTVAPEVREITYANGVTREIPDAVSPGSDAVVTLHIRLADGQTFYIIEEEVPMEIETTAEHDAKNHIKLVDLEAQPTEEYTYTIKAPSVAGTYTFTGKYALEGMNESMEIMGDLVLNVK